MRVSRMQYVSEVRPGIHKVRIVVSPDLRDYLPSEHKGKKNLSKVFEATTEREMQRKAAPIIADYLAVIEEANDRKEQAAEQAAMHANTLKPGRWKTHEPREPINREPVPAAPVYSDDGEVVPFEVAVNKWKRDRHISDREAYLYQFKCDRFAAFLGHDDMKRVTEADGNRYLDDMIANSGYSDRNIKNHVRDLKTIFRYAYKRCGVRPNPLADLEPPLVEQTRHKAVRGFTADEQALILSEARGLLVPYMRWCPWLCWGTGARISEVAECMKADIKQIGGIWCVDICLDNRLEGARLKTAASFRPVPIHSRLIQEGFLAYHRSLPEGMLFPELRERGGKWNKPGKHASSRIAKWLRGLGIIDERIDPSHSWRHTFQALHDNQIYTPAKIIDDIIGHEGSERSQREGRSKMARHYSEADVAAMSLWIEKMVCPLDRALGSVNSQAVPVLATPQAA
jgi:integrase